MQTAGSESCLSPPPLEAQHHRPALGSVTPFVSVHFFAILIHFFHPNHAIHFAEALS